MVKALDAVMKVLGYVLRVLLVFAMSLVILQIICRYAIGHPLTWTEQLCRYSFIWMMMLGLPILFHQKNFMAFDLILHSIPEKIRNWVRVFIDLGITAFAVFWVVGVTRLIIGTSNKMTSGVRIHYYWLYLAQLLSGVLIAWIMTTQAVQNILRIRKGEPLFEQETPVIEEKEGGK